jgi:hypothetical protein
VHVQVIAHRHQVKVLPHTIESPTRDRRVNSSRRNSEASRSSRLLAAQRATIQTAWRERFTPAVGVAVEVSELIARATVECVSVDGVTSQTRPQTSKRSLQRSAHCSIVAGSPSASEIAPQRSVRRTSAPASCHASIVACAGWPNVLCLPTEITAIRGCTAATNAAAKRSVSRGDRP